MECKEDFKGVTAFFGPPVGEWLAICGPPALSFVLEGQDVKCRVLHSANGSNLKDAG